MAKFLRPRRGSKANADSQNIKLQKGEIFLEFPNGHTGKEPGRIIIGDGNSNYQSLDYGTTSTNKFQPFITDPSIYVPRFENTSTSTGSGSINDAMSTIVDIGDGSSASTVTLPNVIGNIKKALIYHGNSINKLDSDIQNVSGAMVNKYDKIQDLNFDNATTTNIYFTDGQSTYTNNGFFIHSERPSDGMYFEYATTETGGIVVRSINDYNYLRMYAFDIEKSGDEMWLNNTPYETGSLTMALNRCLTIPNMSTFKGTGASSLSVSAPYMEGFDFVCWLAISTVGYTRTGYFQDPLAEDTTIWTNNGSDVWQDNMSIKCLCLMRVHDN